MIDQQERMVSFSSQDLLRLGLANLAYVKTRKMDGALVYAVHAADGSELGVTSNRDVAVAAARQQGLEPLSVH
ncbi:MAG TPA: DUF1150 family protein [Kiloniellaceae bacterium]|nr:DUF1150 family protein [Kiloniellaceae bacterium]